MLFVLIIFYPVENGNEPPIDEYQLNDLLVHNSDFKFVNKQITVTM